MSKPMSDTVILQHGNKIAIRTVTLAYFSGTGGTEAIVHCVEAQLIKAGVRVTCVNIPFCTTHGNKIESDLLIIFSPVYAFRLASIVERWTKNLPKTKTTSAAVISISGGGEVFPNTACRAHCKRFLVKNGYSLIYEKMLVMPSNFAIQADQQLNFRLINAMPQKAEQIVTDILSGERNLTNPQLWDRFISFIGQVEHFGARFFGGSLNVSKACTHCGLCERNCPVKNIKIQNGAPSFGFHCIWCLKCVYRCPSQAISPRILRFCVLKNGYDLEELSKQAKCQCDSDYEFPKSILWQGAIDYLK